MFINKTGKFNSMGGGGRSPFFFPQTVFLSDIHDGFFLFKEYVLESIEEKFYTQNIRNKSKI